MILMEIYTLLSPTLILTSKGAPKYGELKGTDMVSNFAIVKAIMEIAFGEHWPDMNVSLLEDFLNSYGKPSLLFDGISNSAKNFNPSLLLTAVQKYHNFMVPFHS